jgi:predicted transcriptional regulator
MSATTLKVNVADVMRKDFVVVDGMESVAGALATMVEKNLEVVFVAKRSDADEYGMLSLATIVHDVLAINRPSQRINVYEIMVKPVIAVHAAMNIRYCARLFSNANIHAAPVIAGGEIIGLVTHRQLAAGYAGMRTSDTE